MANQIRNLSLLSVAFFFSFITASWAVPMRIVVYGDSIVSGYNLGNNDTYANKLNRKLREFGYTDIAVVDMGGTTETTQTARDNMDNILKQNPDVVVLALANNDIWRGVKLRLIERNLEKMLDDFGEKKIRVVLLGAKATGMLGTQYANDVDKMYVRFNRRTNVELYPYILEGIQGNPDLTLADGHHPNNNGMEFLVEQTAYLVDNGIRERWGFKEKQSYEQLLESSLSSEAAQAGVTVIPEKNAPKAAKQKLSDQGSATNAMRDRFEYKKKRRKRK